MLKPGYAASQHEIKPLLGAIGDSHPYAREEKMPNRSATVVVSMWGDTNIYNRMGVPALTCGPSRGRAGVQGTGCFKLDNRLEGANIYALTVLSICAGVSLRL